MRTGGWLSRCQTQAVAFAIGGGMREGGAFFHYCAPCPHGYCREATRVIRGPVLMRWLSAHWNEGRDRDDPFEDWLRRVDRLLHARVTRAGLTCEQHDAE